MNLFELPLDIKVLIATSTSHLAYPESDVVFNIFMKDSEFNKYMFSHIGRNTYLNSFMKYASGHVRISRDDGNTVCEYKNATYLFGNINSISGISIKTKNGYDMFIKNGKFHRDDDEPSFRSYMYNIYCKNGVIHRDTDSPSMIDYRRESTQWYQNGKIYKSFYGYEKNISKSQLETYMPDIQSPFYNNYNKIGTREYDWHRTIHSLHLRIINISTSQI